MIRISYAFVFSLITVIWVLVRLICAVKNKKVSLKRELQLLLVYICVAVVVRFTFFPFHKVDGAIQPLVFEGEKAFPFRTNLVPFANFFDYPTKKDALINITGNVTMFIPLGIVWPAVFRKLDTHGKAIAAGVGIPLCIEILQLPFYDRVTDFNDLFMNTAGYLIGYGIYLLVKNCRRNKKTKR